MDLIDRVNLENEAMDGSAIQNVFRSYAIQDLIRSVASATGIDANYIQFVFVLYFFFDV